MIRESEHFFFADRKSTDFGIRNVKVENGLYNEPVVASKTIREVQIPGRDEPYFLGVTEEPKTFEVRFAFLQKWDDDLIDEVIRWLNVDTYQPLYFSADIDRVFFVIPVNGITQIHNGLKEGYLNLTMRCNSGKTYSHEINTPEYNTFELAKKQGASKFDVSIINRGHFSIYPDIWIEKIGKGDIEIYNTTNGNELLRLKNIKVGERLFIDCEREIIKTSEKDTYRYDDFNDNYLKLVYGDNRLKISDNIRIRFRYRYIFS